MSYKFDNNIPIYVQLVNKFKIDIISGKIKPGDRLLSVRDLAFEAKVNPNTIQKALSELEELKLIYTESTNGKFVTKDEKLIDSYKKKYADEISNIYFKGMECIGFDSKEAINYLKQIGGDK